MGCLMVTNPPVGEKTLFSPKWNIMQQLAAGFVPDPDDVKEVHHCGQ